MTFKCTQSSGAQSIFCSISFGKKPINNQLFVQELCFLEEMGKFYMHSLAFTSDKHFQWEKNVHISFEWLQFSSKEKPKKNLKPNAQTQELSNITEIYLKAPPQARYSI